MATATVTQVVTHTITATGTPSSTLRAAAQGGILEGADPTHYDLKNPIIIFIIQAGIIITLCRLLHWPLSKLRQPRVIAEVVAGVILGPSVMGHIPHFQTTIFPTAAMPNLTLVANLGLVLFLFLVGLEVDLRFLVSNWRTALSVGFGGMALPFGLGCAVAWGLYHQFRTDAGLVAIDFGVYMLFVGVAMAITAFPVLCRILTELKLLSTPVGIIVLSAGVGNDVVGWILLALCVALVNAATGLTALYVFLVAVGWTLFLAYAVRPALMWFLVRTRSLQDGPSQGVICLVLMMALASAFFTGVIGVHPIFGAFLVGLICPHEGGFAIKVTEKVEDLVTAIFLPLYFALSGLSTNLGLLDSGLTWGYVFAVIFVAFFGKMIGGALAARFNGLVWRECFTIGALMSCKGLVELIVLNIGLQAKVLSERTFTIFVVMALVTTFATTPLVSVLYPPSYQRKLEAWKRGEIDWDTGLPYDADSESRRDSVALAKAGTINLNNLLVYLRLDSMPGVLTLMSLIGGSNERINSDIKAALQSKTPSGSLALKGARPVQVHGVRLMQLTERDSSVMQSAEMETYAQFDPIANTLRAFGRLNSVPVSTELTVSTEAYFADTLASKTVELGSDMLLLPWCETGVMSEMADLTVPPRTTEERLHSEAYTHFAKRAMKTTKCHIALFVNNGFGGTIGAQEYKLSRSFSAISNVPGPHGERRLTNSTHRIFMPFCGSNDDKVALSLAITLARDARVALTIAHINVAGEEEDWISNSGRDSPIASSSNEKKTASATTKPVPLKQWAAAYLETQKSSLPADVAERINIISESSDGTNVEQLTVELAQRALGTHVDNAGDLCIIGRNTPSGSGEFALGRIGVKIASCGLQTSLIVVQAQKTGEEKR